MLVRTALVAGQVMERLSGQPFPAMPREISVMACYMDGDSVEPSLRASALGFIGMEALKGCEENVLRQVAQIAGRHPERHQPPTDRLECFRAKQKVKCMIAGEPRGLFHVNLAIVSHVHWQSAADGKGRLASSSGDYV